jgi:hypothetical protein
MSRDIIFKTYDYVFSYRVAGLLQLNGRVLVTGKIKGRDFGKQKWGGFASIIQ